MPGNVVNDNSEVYYSGVYWNDLKPVRDQLNRQVSGDPEVTWSEHFARRVGRTFQRALILNCGNGHVERALVDEGLIAEAVGIDYSEELLGEARAAARGRPLRYHQMDVNTAAFPDEDFDLVVNFAAAHHIAAIDRVFRRMSELLDDDGWMVAWDYVGPHRNQYGYEAWDAAWQLNQSLPVTVRQEMRYPHLPTMLVTDPTEAIHSELIVETFHRYFRVDEYIGLGGALAYPLLTHNTAMFSADESHQAPAVTRILAADAAFSAAHPGSELFAYFSGQPDRTVRSRPDDLARWRIEEDEREEAAAGHGGEYYPHTALQDLMLELEDQRIATLHARTDLDRTRAELDEAETRLDRPWRGLARYELRRLAHSRTGEAWLKKPALASLADRARRYLG